VAQSPLSVTIESPVPVSATTISDRHASPEPSKESTVRTPLPAAIDAPLKLKPTTVVALEDTVNPASPAAPPDTPVMDTSDTLNWKPKIGVSVL
jgi:hypothetical protein